MESSPFASVGFLAAMCCLYAAVPSTTNTDQRILDDYIRHYEEVHYDAADLHQKHLRHKRSLNSHVHLHFRAFGRNFKLKLKRDLTIFAPDHEHRHPNGTKEDVDTSFVYKGVVEGYPGSTVFGAIIAGIFTGEIDIPNVSTFHVETSNRYFPDEKPFHSVIYSEKDLNMDPFREKRDAARGGCALESVYESMRLVQESVIRQPSKVTLHNQRKHEYEKYLEQTNVHPPERLERNKRSIKTLKDKNTCTLFLQSDPELWKHMLSTFKNDKERAKDEILTLFATHVRAIKSIYGKTTFETYDGRIGYRGIDFVVQRTTIMTLETEHCNDRKRSTRYCNRNMDVSNFLNLNSLKNHDDFCLAYIFTNRDFNGGTLGLAWVGSPDKAAGGICEKYQEYPEIHKKVKKSLNTGIITLINFNKQVPPKVSQLTFAHEVGHNFGSPHDKGSYCAPYGTNQPSSKLGNYIMFASATSGDKTHNSEFSPCSKDNITLVLDAVIMEKNSKKNCFVSPKAAFCGNKLVEKDEECDCGYKDDCTSNSCCHYKAYPGGLECKLKKPANCSETSGPCCNGSTCNFIPSFPKMKCHTKEGCTLDSFCNGKMATCPEPGLQPNYTLCNQKTKICIKGECSGSICKKIDWEECFLTAPNDDKGFDRGLLCYVSCRNPKTGACISSKRIDLVGKEPLLKQLLKNISKTGKPEPLQLPAGSPCDNFRGYCDVFHRCRRVDAEGPLARLKNLIFNQETLETIKEWIEAHWWAVMLMCIGLVLFMAAFIKVCAVHTPSSNPRKPPARKFSLRPSRSQIRQPPLVPQLAPQLPPPQGPPPPYSGELPITGPHPGHGRGPRFESREKLYKGKGKDKENIEMI